MDRLSSPPCVAFDEGRRLYVADRHWHNIFVLDRAKEAERLNFDGQLVIGTAQHSVIITP